MGKINDDGLITKIVLQQQHQAEQEKEEANKKTIWVFDGKPKQLQQDRFLFSEANNNNNNNNNGAKLQMVVGFDGGVVGAPVWAPTLIFFSNW
jgi:hypothetical protein